MGIDGHTLLLFGIGFCVLGLIFGLMIYSRLKNLPVHRSMREISELIYETCKTYLITQGKFLLLLEAFIAVVIVLYFGVLQHYGSAARGHHSALQRGRNRRQLWRGLVRHSRQYLCQFAHGVCRACAASPIPFTRFRWTPA